MKRILILIYLLLALGARADKITLANGETLEGTILKETPEAVEIEYQYTASIKDVKIIPRAEIASIEKSPPDEVAYNKIAKLVPLPDMSPERDYRRVLDKHLRPFLTAFPASKKVADVKRMVEALETELKRISDGDFRINGVWVTPADYKKKKHYYDGLLLQHEMGSLAAAMDFPAAMRNYEKLRTSHFYTEEFPDIFKSARQILTRYKQRIEQMILEQPILQQKREQGLNTTSNSDDLARTKAAIEKEMADFALQIEGEKKAGQKWVSIHPYHPESLQLAKISIETAMKEMDGFNLTQLSSYAVLIRDASVAAENGDMEKMTALLAEALASGAPKDLIDATRKSFETAVAKPTPAPEEPGTTPEKPKPEPEKPMPDKPSTQPSIPDKVDDVDDLESMKSPTQRAMEAVGKERDKNIEAEKNGPAKPAGPTTAEKTKELTDKAGVAAKTTGKAIAQIGEQIAEEGLGTTNLMLAAAAGVLVLVTIGAWIFNKRKSSKSSE